MKFPKIHPGIFLILAVIAGCTSGLARPLASEINDVRQEVKLTHCQPGASPVLPAPLLTLQGQLGNQMGNPVECAWVDPASGDTRLFTTNGLGYVRKSTGVPVFTDGRQHWALTDQLLYWTTGEVDPPPGATVTELVPVAKPSASPGA